jgi:hypothetical protein
MIVADTTWQEAALGMAGIAFVTIVLSVFIWQIFATWRTRMLTRQAQAQARQAPAVEATGAQRSTTASESER